MWRRISLDPRWLSGGKGVCPLDATMLVDFRGENVPPGIAIKRCVRCGKWWFPSDSLFRYKPAVEAKVNYFRLWGLQTDFSALALPVTAVVVLSLGTWWGVKMVQNRQGVKTEAGVGIRDFSATYVGGGEVIVTFKTERYLERVKYQKVGETFEHSAEITSEGGVNVVRLSGLEYRQWYVLKVGEKEYHFQAL